jgi:hypothetical protein
MALFASPFSQPYATEIRSHGFRLPDSDAIILQSSHRQPQMPTTTHATKVILIINDQGLASSEIQILCHITVSRKFHQPKKNAFRKGRRRNDFN